MALKLPQPLRRREILYGIDTPAETLSSYGDAYLEEGLVFDAADFFAQARDPDGLRKIKELAIRTGDAFLLRRVREAMPDLVEKADWDELARAARSLGKDAYASRAEAGGAPPPPPLQEELVQEEEALVEEAAEEAGARDDAAEGRPGQAAKRTRKREIQGG